MSVAEALWSGIPVITTTGTLWKELMDSGCGWWIEPSVKALSEILNEAMGLSGRQRQRMGQKSKKLVKAFEPHAVADRIIEMYRIAIKKTENSVDS